ncbi:MAG: chromosomal replication initiator protein DnaA [Dehalococcoidia bacterium]|nr:MAG: chromosomal replication initiator protein DnaA [Dehalococcoidia bacterium]
MKSKSASDIWQSALEELQGKVSSANYQTWLKNTVGLSQRDGSLVVGVPSTFVTESLEKRLHPLIEKTVSGIAGRQLSVEFQVHLGDAQEELGPSLPAVPRQQYSQRSSPPKVNHRYTFETFLVGTCNRLANAAALRVANDPGSSYNPLFIYSGVGLGKTHLLHAIGWVSSRSCPRVMYVTAEQFTNEFIGAIRDGKSEDFRNKYRSVDVLLLDDIQFIAGKEQTQEGLFHTFNDLHNANRQIVLSCDRPPKSLTLLEDRLRSRFEWGLTVDMQPPDLETRIAILQKKAEEQKTEVPPEVLDLIARRIQKNIRELEGALNRILAYSRLIKEPLTPELVTKSLSEISADAHKRSLSPALILNSVATFYGLNIEVLQGKRRDKPLSVARQMAMYLLREELQCSWTQIGNELGGRDHSTVLHGYKKMSTDINTDPAMLRDLLEIRERLYTKAL